MTDSPIRDVVVIGAGPAGSVSAFRLARAGYSVLLVERSRFPRNKVCGGCLSARSLALLGEAGLEPAVFSAGRAIRTVTIATPGSRERTFPLPAGLAVTRAELDQRIVEAAIRAGVEFRPGVAARVLPTQEGAPVRSILLSPGNEVVGASAVVAADGLGHPSLSGLAAGRSVVRPSSRVGLGAVVDIREQEDLDGTVRMAVAGSGYVGMVDVGGGRLNLAAALDPSRLSSAGPPAVVARILTDCGLAIPSGLPRARWSGTPALSRRLAHPAGFRLLVLGDASGYTEPFTGEGMAWAFEDALAAERLLAAGVGDWNAGVESAWIAHVRSRRRRDWFGRTIARLLRAPRAAGGVAALMERLPALASRGIRTAQAPAGAVVP